MVVLVKLETNLRIYIETTRYLVRINAYFAEYHTNIQITCISISYQAYVCSKRVVSFICTFRLVLSI